VIVRHPAERYIRLRIWQGVDHVALHEEASIHLRLPGVAGSKRGEFTPAVSAIVDTSRVDRPVKLVSSKSKKASSKAPQTWLDVQDVTKLSESEYLKYFGLDGFIGSSARTAKFRNAIMLWQHDLVRTLLRGLISADCSDTSIADTIKDQVPKLRLCNKRAPRPVDVEAVRLLFWDLSGMGVADRLMYVGGMGLNMQEAAAVTGGSEEFLWRLGRGSLKYTDLQRYEDARDVAHTQIRMMRARPEKFDHREFTSAYGVMDAAVLKVQEIQAELSAGAEDELDKMKLRDAEDFQNLGDILREIDYSSDHELLEQVNKYGGIDSTRYQELLNQVSSGRLLDYGIRMELSDWLDDRLAPEKDDELFGAELGSTQAETVAVEYESDVEEVDAEVDEDLDVAHSLSLTAMLS